MRKLYVAATEACRSAFECEREVIDFDNANFTEVSIAVMTAEQAKAGKLERVESTAFGIPVVILNECGEVDPNITGEFPNNDNEYEKYYSGAFSIGSVRLSGYSDAGDSTGQTGLFRASRSSSTYGFSTTVQPSSVRSLFCIKS